MKSKNDRKLEKIYKICNSQKTKYNLSDKATEKCVMSIKKRWGVKKA